MRLNYFVLSKLLLSGCLIGFLLSSFQQPKDKNTIQDRMAWHRQNQHLDSFVFYQNLLLKILSKQATETELQLVGEDFLATVMSWDKIEIAQKKQLFKNNPKSKVWEYAYQTQFQLEQSRQDSAYFYAELLKAEPNNLSALAYTYCLFASNFARKDNLKEAHSQLKNAESLVQTTQDSAFLYPTQANVYLVMGFWEEAAIAIEKQIHTQYNQKYKNRTELAYLYRALANLAFQQEHYVQAKGFYTKAINNAHNQPIEDDFNILLQYQIGRCWTKINHQSNEAILYLHKILKLLDDPKNKTNAALNSKITIDVYNLMASEFVEKKQLDSAIIYIEKASVEQKKLPHELDKTWMIQSQIQTNQNKWVEAENTLYKTIGFIEKNKQKTRIERAVAWHALGEIYLQQQKLKQAQTAIDKAFQILCPQTIANEIPSTESMLPNLQTVKILVSKIDVMLALYEKSIYHVSLKDIYFFARSNIQLLQQIYTENSDYKDLLKTTIRAYEQVIESCVLLYERHQDKMYLEQAFYLSEQFKKSHVEKQLEEPQQQKFGAVPTEMIQLEKQYEKRINRYKQQAWQAAVENDSLDMQWQQQLIATFQANQKILERKLSKNYPKYYQWKYENPIAKLDSIQQFMPDSTVLVQYVEGEKFVYQFLVKKDTFAVRRIVWNAYKPTMLKYYKHFTDSKLMQHSQSGSYKDFCMTGYELYHKILHHEFVQRSKQLIIIPDGLLSYIPFETLLTDIPLDSVHKINFPNLAFLLKQKSISYNYSATYWLNQFKQKNAPINNQILAMGATYKDEEIPTFRTQKQQTWRKKLQPFNGASSEVDSLSVKYAGDFYTNRYATEYYLKRYAPKYGLLHLAVHGLINQQNPEYSCLALAEDGYESEDNFLFVNEIKQLEMNASLVVLSNCPTAYGQQQRGEGSLALGASFAYAGASAVVLSLWQQQENYAPEVMDYFYKNLKNKMPKDEALRQAKLHYLKSAKGIQAHPAFWASYVQFGNNEAIEISEPVTYSWWFVIPIAFVGFLGWWSMRALRQR